MAERKARVLIVDDASLLRLYYREILEGAGYEVDEALNGLEALERVLETPPDLLIVDVNMPQMDGITFLSDSATPSASDLAEFPPSSRARKPDRKIGSRRERPAPIFISSSRSGTPP